MYYNAFLAGLAALAFYSVADIVLKVSSSRSGGIQTSFIASVSGTALLIILSLFYTTTLNFRSILLSVVTGIFMGSGTMMVLRSLETEQVSDTMAFVAISYAIPVIFGVVFLKEHVGPVEWAGIVLIFAGSAAVSLKDMKLNTFLLPAIVGNVVWGLQFITFSMAIQSAGFVPVAALSSAVSIIPIAAYLLLTEGFKFRASAQAAFAGVLLALGLLGALVVLESGATALGMSIIAAEPALVTLLGFIIFKERINGMQVLGVVMATIGIVVVTA